ncbi:MAG: hypothetical protein E6G89_18990 [Alphaproteobacteria bacterium]|nr:MAG: hypothetical protein E6G89_18990 [Alphaproteobacteria bacterium]
MLFWSLPVFWPLAPFWLKRLPRIRPSCRRARKRANNPSPSRRLLQNSLPPCRRLPPRNRLPPRHPLRRAART